MQPNSPEMGHLLGVLSPGERQLEGKSFYLDTLKSRLAAMLMEAISHLGGTVEGFLNKDVSCVVTCSPEGLGDVRAKAPCPQPGSGLGDVRAKAPCPQPGSGLGDVRAKAPCPQPGSGLGDVRAKAPCPQPGSGLGDVRAKAPCPQPGSGLGDVRAKAPCPQPGSALRDRRTEASPRGGPGFRDVRADAPRGREGLMGGRAEVCGPRGGSDGMGGKEMGSARLTKQREGVPAKNSTPRPQMEQVYGSRGKALLEKAMRNNERLHGNSVLANARSWGVKIVHVDDFLSYVEMLKAENSKVKSRRPERNTNKCQATRVVKAVALKSPYMKVEDSCRKYRPLQMQSMTFPTLFYSGRRSSPFEPLPPPQPERIKDKKHNKAREMLKEPNTSQEKPQSPLLRVPSPCRARKKNLGYCECCQEPFQDQEEHLRSEQHRGFVRDSSHYSAVDQLVASMQPGFHPDPPAQRSPTLMRVPSPQALAPPSPPDLEHHTHSEAEHAVHILLTQGPPPGVLSASPAPLSTTGPAAAAPGPANLPLYTQRLYLRPPDTPPSAPHSQPPVLSPENLEPVDFHQPYSDPPVLSPQVPLPPPTEPEDAETGSPAPVTASSEADLIHRAAPEAPVQLPAPLGPSAGLDHVVMAMGPNQGSPLLGHSALSCGRSSSLPLPSSSTQNPRKRCRSASPAPDPNNNNNNNNKRRRTSLITHQRSEPSSGRTGQEAKTLTSFPRTECNPPAKASRHPVDTCETAVHRPNEEEWVFRNRCPAGTAQTQETSYGNAEANGRSRSNSGAVNERCISTGDKTTSSFSREVLLGGAELLHLATFPLPRAASSPSGKRTACHGSLTRAGERSGPAAPHASRVTSWVTPPPPSPSLRERPHRPPPASRQDSHPSQSFSSSVCIESALVPDLAALSPSRSSSEWDYELLARLCPAAAAPAPALPPSRAAAAAVLDMELLQRPCAWAHDAAGYESRLYSVLRPPTPPASLCGEERGPAAFARVMQSVEVLH